MAECILIALQFARKMKPPCNPRRRNCHFFIDIFWGWNGFDSIVDAINSRRTATVKIVAKDNWQYESNSNVSRISDS